MNLQLLHRDFNYLISQGDYVAAINLLQRILQNSPTLQAHLLQFKMDDPLIPLIIQGKQMSDFHNFSSIYIHFAIMAILLEIEHQISAAEKIQAEVLKVLETIAPEYSSAGPVNIRFARVYDFLLNTLHFSRLTASQLIQKGNIVNYRRGTTLLTSEDGNLKMGVVVKGIVKAYYETSSKKRNVTLFIMKEGAIVADFDQIFLNNSAPLKFECLEDCEILELDYPEIQVLQKQYHEICLDVNRFLEAQLTESLIRIRSFVLNDGKKRVAALWESNKDLFLRVSKKDLAYFVALEPESLSRIMNSLRSQ